MMFLFEPGFAAAIKLLLRRTLRLHNFIQQSDAVPLYLMQATVVCKITKAGVFRLLLVGLPGFEPRHTEPKSVVLPLHNRPILNGLQK